MDRSPKKAKPKPNKTLIASLLVVAFLAAFAAAFYFLGGQQVVNDLLSGILGIPTAPSPVTPPPSVPTSETPSGIKLPPGVDEAFAKRVYVEQMESQVNIGKLVIGEVSSMSIGRATPTSNGAEIAITAEFADKTSGPGIMSLAKKGTGWFFEYVSGQRGAVTGGLADTISGGVDETDPGHVKAAAAAKVDTDVLNTMLAQQMKSQDVLAGMASGKYVKLTFEKPKKGQGTVTLDVTLTGSDGSSSKGHVLCITKSIDGKAAWFVTSFTKG